jgi:DnaK suppressor protein
MSTTSQDLVRIKDALLARRTSLKQRHQRIQQDLQRRTDPLAPDAPDRAVQQQNDAALHVIDDATNDELVTLDAALQRLDQGLYGICKQCGSEIEDGRLEMLHAVTCSDCARD